MRFGLALSGLILACAGAAVEPSPPTHAAPAVRPSAPAPCAAHARAGEQPAQLSVRLRPAHDDDGGGVDVALEVTAPGAELRSWRVPQLAGELAVRVTATACGGPAQQQSLQGAAGQLLGVTLPAVSAEEGGRATLRLEYRVAAQRLDAPFWRLEPDWFLAQGRRLLLLPEARDWAADVRVDIDASGYGSDARAVSSLGLVALSPQAVPRRPLRMTVAALEYSLFAAGKLGSAQFVAREGQDEAAWFGSTGFDVRLLAAEVASFRTAVREVLLDGATRPLTLIVMSDLQHGFEARRAPISVLLRMTPWDRASAGLRLDVLQQVMKEWIGGRLSVQDERGIEPLWFGEGLSRYLARELALEFGMISPEEFAADVNALMAMQAVLAEHECTRRRMGPAAEEQAAPEREPSGPPACARVLEAARGILHATQLDTALRAQRSSLVQLVSALLERSDGPLTLSQWREALEGAGGAAALSVHDAFLGAPAGRPLLLPSNAFGACFVREPAHYVQSLLGFQLEERADGPALRVTAVAAASPAAAAGLKADTLLQRIEHVPHDPERPIRLLLQSGSPLEYRGAEARVPGHAWRRVPGVKEDRCRMSGREYPSAR
jgi:hypothetical protein